MKVIPFLIAVLLVSADAFNQTPLVVDFEVHHSECRLFGYQNGNGVLTGSAAGGNPGYTYEWKNLSTGATSPNSTWGGLIPGPYKFKVIDNSGDTAVVYVNLDSITPIADFAVEGPGMSQITAGYIGFAPVNATFYNLSQYTSVFYDPTSGGTYSWQFESGGPLDISLDSAYAPTHHYSSGGTYSSTLTVQNKNGCSDSKTKQIGLFDLTDTDELSNGYFTLEAVQSDHILFQKTNHFETVIFKMFDLNGKLVLETEISDQVSYISHSQNSGLYLYQIIDKSNLKSISGKIQIK